MGGDSEVMSYYFAVCEKGLIGFSTSGQYPDINSDIRWTTLDPSRINNYTTTAWGGIGHYFNALCSANEVQVARDPDQDLPPTPTDNLSDCPNNYYPVVVRTPSGQSPSYAGAENAGANRNATRNDGSKIAPDHRCISLIEVNAPENPVETFIVIHGWDDSPYGKVQNLANVIKDRNPRIRVLMLDWSEASFNAGDDGSLRRLHNSLEKFSRGNYYAATWIRPISEVVVSLLRERYKISDNEAADRLNLIGHSLGSLMSSEIASLYSYGANYLIALDPPSEINVAAFGDQVGINDLGGYDLDGRTPAYTDVRQIELPNPLFPGILPPLKTIFETRTLVPENVDRPKDFSSVASFSRSFVGRYSFAGNQLFAGTAHESFQMDFGSRSDISNSPGTEHGLVVDSFTTRILGEGLIPHFLGLQDRSRHNDMKADSYAYQSVSTKEWRYIHEGVIYISDSNQFSGFSLSSAKYGKVSFYDENYSTDSAKEDEIDLIASGGSGRVAGGSYLPSPYEIFPSLIKLPDQLIP